MDYHGIDDAVTKTEDCSNSEPYNLQVSFDKNESNEDEYLVSYFFI